MLVLVQGHVTASTGILVLVQGHVSASTGTC